ncbi:S-layer homology domain-containing protein [Salibacterium halotolerans]|uniref:S-layer homology domain-containing protein n=1 Tax=Salibacterium halotolerans TaxID=1884432 RepID=A0A1I5L3W6_9BACI|nr:S-layer homology domain-containing protein [Salibacterium halotolerans]SFO91852.1 S-layer homology domain-containing protein [Salibacterium halotolerans]
MMSYTSKWIMGAAMAAAVCVSAVISPQAPRAEAATAFSDVGEDYWASGSIQRLSEQDILGGYSDGTFAPGEQINRGQAASMLVRAFDLNMEEQPASTFEDLNGDSYFTPAAEAVKKAGLMGGRENNTLFSADRNLSREQMASILVRAFGLQPQEDKQTVIADIEDASPTHRANIEILAGHGITSTPDQRFHPRDSVTRAQFAVFLERAMADEYTKEQGLTGVSVVDDNTIDVEFTQAPDTPAAGQFSLDPAVNVTRAEMAGGSTVRLTVEGMQPDQSYSLSYKGTWTGETVQTAPEPVVEDVMASGLKQVTVQFNRDINGMNVTDSEAYRLATTGGSTISVESIQAEGDTVTLNLNEARPQGDTAVLQLSAPVVPDSETYNLVFFDETL